MAKLHFFVDIVTTLLLFTQNRVYLGLYYIWQCSLSLDVYTCQMYNM